MTSLWRTSQLFSSRWFFSGLLVLSCVKQRAWWTTERTHSALKISPSANDSANRVKHSHTIFSPDQVETLKRFERFQNNPRSLFKLALPCLVSVAMCPLTISLLPELWDFLYPFDDTRKKNINSTLSAFLVPASLVYSLMWGFALQDALAKFDVTDANAKHHASLLKQIRELILQSKALSLEHKQTMLQKLCGCTTQWMLRQMGESNHCNGLFTSDLKV